MQRRKWDPHWGGASERDGNRRRLATSSALNAANPRWSSRMRSHAHAGLRAAGGGSGRPRGELRRGSVAKDGGGGFLPGVDPLGKVDVLVGRRGIASRLSCAVFLPQGPRLGGIPPPRARGSGGETPRPPRSPAPPPRPPAFRPRVCLLRRPGPFFTPGNERTLWRWLPPSGWWKSPR